MSLTRRVFEKWVAGAALCGILQRRSAAAGGLTWGAEPAPETGRERRYRAHAQVLLLSVPLMRWPNVGGGSAVWRETTSSRAKVRFLEFTGFSNPERAAGLNRLGFLRELSRIGEDGLAEALYFGLMTASPEETAEQARKAMHPTAKEATYTAIDGRLAPGILDTVVAHFTAPARWSMANRSDLLERARAALSAARPRLPESDARGATARPFLHALAGALGDADRTETQFVYAGRGYRLWVEKSADPKTTTYFRARGVIATGSNVVRATGRLRREAGGKESNFRLWVEEGAMQPLPVRIEYQAKSYLRLVFEAEV